MKKAVAMPFYPLHWSQKHQAKATYVCIYNLTEPVVVSLLVSAVAHYMSKGRYCKWLKPH